MSSSLTGRERQVKSLVVEERSTDEIAAALGISARTVEAHLQNIFKKLGVSRREQLADVPENAPPAAAPSRSHADDLRALQAENRRLSKQIESYDAAVQQMIERQFPLFEERVEVTVTIGASSGEDMVVERHWTTPKPYVVYRVARPILPKVTAAPSLEELALTCEVVGQDTGVAVQPVLERSDRLLVVIFFQPGVGQTTEWVLRYQTAGMWDPLRADGEDTLGWSSSTLDNRIRAGITDVTFYFDFPAGSAGAEVTQERPTGDLKEDTLPDGAPRFTWHNYVPGRHNWTLRMPVR